VYLLCLFGTVAVRDKGYLGSCASILCVLLCAIVRKFSSVEIAECVSFGRVVI